jgi:enamine deaminase RidA (YjgF/YER057c/UK114 family)
VDKRVVNPWTWQDQFGFVQANEISGAQRVLVCAGQGAVDADGTPMHAGDMRAQVALTLDNIETVLTSAGFGWADVVRLNYFTTDVDRFFEAADILGERLASSGCRPVSTLLGVTRLAFPEMLVEMEVTAMK